MADSCKHNNPLRHQGTSQAARFLKALDPANVELHGLGERDWLQFAYEYARLINYYPEDSPDHPNGNWQPFFEENEEDINVLLERYGDGDVEPHIALFICFLKLLAYPQQSLNQLPKRHLNFYYKEVLRIEKTPFTPDRVHVLFELAKNATQELVEEGVPLKAGKDSDGNPLQYKTTTSLVVNPAKVASLRSAYIDEDGLLRYAPAVNSLDGKGTEFEDDRSWSAFGNSAWPEAELSFYVASRLLSMKEGTRTVTLDFDLADPSKLDGILETNIEAQFTGEKGWLDPVDVEFVDGDRTQLRATLPAEMDQVVEYDEAVHKATLYTAHPVVKFRLKKAADYRQLKETKINSIKLSVDVSNIASLQLQNELGNVDPSKPFMPFGSRPKIGSKLSIVYPEMYGKPISGFDLNMQWLNVPANFTKHYDKYFNDISIQKNLYYANYPLLETFPNSFAINKDDDILQDEINELELLIPANGSESEDSPTDSLRDNFRVHVDSSFIPGRTTSPLPLFSDEIPQITINNAPETREVSKGEIELLLTESFYHDLYPELYVNAVKMEGTVDLPNEPYTPLLDALLLNYTAEEDITFADEPDEKTSVMFHRHPFGTKRLDALNQPIIPKYGAKELYIGLENMESGSNISLLFQVEGGSENPLHSSFDEDEEPSWAVLSNNDWIDVGDELARDETNNFLRSGIVEVPIPKDATNNHTLFDSGLHWIRVSLNQEIDAVCDFIDVHAQAGMAEFDNQDNATGHLKEGLPAETISKFVNPRAQIKSIVQPYASFGGKPTETDAEYYRRVSERLRHKNRAVSIWDYEHLVLQQFPSLYKAKCLNHAYWDGTKLDELRPGEVTLVLIPKIAGTSAEFRLKPKVSQDFKDRVQEFVTSHNSLHANIKVVDPVYEPVKFTFSVRFREGLDGNFYKARTVEDLKRLLAPWVFDLDASISFEGSFTEYQIVNYLENLPYVDFIENFHMYHRPQGGTLDKVTEAKPSIPMAILVPHPEQKNGINVIETSSCAT